MGSQGKEQEEKQEKKCFIITPIGDSNSVIFRKAKGVIESVIRPVLQKNGFNDIKAAYEINISGMITTQIINRIIDDDLVIVNLTGNNPNVMYEMCLRHVVAKPIIHICENGTILPFDIKDSRTIFYENDMLGVSELKESLKRFLVEIDYGVDYSDNPIYTAYKFGNLLKMSNGTEKETGIKLLLDILDSISDLKSETNINISENTGVISINEEYTVSEFVNELKHVDKNKVADESLYRNKMRVYELAKEWNTYSKVIVAVGDLLGIKLNSSQSSLEKSEIQRIAKYICDNQ
jgi:hypothetical protein